MSSFTEVFGGTTIWPSDVSYLPLDLDANITLEWPLEAAAGENIIARIVNITPSGDYTITMPDATQTGNGQTVLFNNLGPNDVTIVKSGGGALLSLSAGEVWQVYLTNNTTAAGTWSTFQYGASTAQAQAAALEGPGIVAIGSVLAQEMAVSTINTTPYTITTADLSAAFVWIGALGTFNLPAAATAGNGWFINVRNGGTGNLTIDPSSTETINDATTLVMLPGDSAVIATDGLEWWTIGLGRNAVFAFDYTSISLAGLSGTYTLSGAELNRIAYQFTGALAGNLEVVVPPTIQQYWVNNQATGFTLSLNTASGTPVNIASGDKSIFYCDGTNVVLAVTTSGIATPISIADGGTGATSATNARSNLAAAKSGANADITSLTGLTAAIGSITFSGDANTGYGSSAADTLAGQVGGNVAFFVSNSSTGNVSFGSTALDSITTGVRNIAFGYAALTADTSGSDNTGLGVSALALNTTGGTNIAVGGNALSKNVSGSANTAIGHNAGLEVRGTRNTCVGSNTIFSTSASGDDNVTVGAFANVGGNGSQNTIIGANSNSVTSGSNNTTLGYAATASTGSVSNEVTLGNASISSLRCAVTTITAISDARDKDDIRPLPMGMDLEFINTLVPRLWTWNMRDGAKVGMPDIGFVAQELKSAMEQCGVDVPGLVYESNPDRLEAASGILLPIAVRAIQQLSDALDATNGRLRKLEELLG